MIAERAGDGTVGGNPLFSEGTDAGDWRRLAPTANNFQWVGDVDPFLMLSPSQFRSPGPLALGSDKYAAEFNQVKALGTVPRGPRGRADQTAMALFWSDNPIAMWNRIFRQIAVNEDLSSRPRTPGSSAMLLLTGADAAIGCFEAKERLGFLASDHRDPGGVARRQPGHVAGSGLDRAARGSRRTPTTRPGTTASATRSCRRCRTSSGPTRCPSARRTRRSGSRGPITRFSQAISEIRRARVYGGLHFMTADAQGRRWVGRSPTGDWRTSSSRRTRRGGSRMVGLPPAAPPSRCGNPS